MGKFTAYSSLIIDQIYAELTPNQQIDLLFALPQKQNQTTTTTSIFYTNDTITQLNSTFVQNLKAK